MSNTAELLNYEIYPAIYASAEGVFPEFDFKPTRGGYISTSDHKITGEAGKPGKVCYYANNVSHLKDWTRGAISVWDYIQKRDNLGTNQEVLERLAYLAGVSLPPLDYATNERIIKARTSANIWQDANGYFAFYLTTDTPKAKQIREYLTARGYTAEDITEMELGCIPSQEHLYKYLEETKGHPEEAIQEAIKLHPSIGAQNILTIPYRAENGEIRGIAARSIEENPAGAKYLYSTGLKRDEILFNLKAVKETKDLIIVEGLLDSLIVTARGFDNVVALGGTSLNKAQVERALKFGSKRFTLCLDNDKAGAEATQRALAMLRELDNVFICILPKGVKDPDQLIKEQGAEALKRAINEAVPYWKYSASMLCNKYLDLAATQADTLTEKQTQDFLDEAVTYGQQITSPTHRDRYATYFTQHELVKALGITTETIQTTVEKLHYKAEEDKRGKLLRKLQTEALLFLDKGENAQAINLLERGVKEAKLQTVKDLLPAYSFQDWQAEISATPLGLKTGYRKIDQIAAIPQGAITLIAARPGSGKTTLMFNLLLSLSRLYGNGKRFYFFTYEEPKKVILAKMLNCLIGEDLTKYYADYNSNTNLNYLLNYIKNPRTKRDEVEQGRETLRRLLDSGTITVMDRSYTVEELGTIVQHLSKQGDVGAVFVDYIQKMSTEKKTQDKRLEVAHISAQVLQTAKDTGLPIILGAQLNRGAGDSPGLINLKEAGNLEEDANLVLSVYNESVEKETPTEGGDWGREVKLEIKALKNRDGEPNKKIDLYFDRWTLKINDNPIIENPF